MKEKSDEQSIVFREKGNQKFRNLEFYSAIEAYNKVNLKSACVA